MKISSIKIANFKLLADITVEIPAHQSGLVFINGLNGHGKTTLKSSLEWCLFGANQGNDFVSHSTLKGKQPGDFVEVSVEVEFSNSDNSKTYVKRFQTMNVLDGSKSSPSSQPSLLIRIQPANPADPTEILDNPDAWLEKNLPKRLLSYVLFDGEQMEKFFDSKVKSAVEDAVREIAGIDLFDNVKKKLDDIESKTNQKIAKLSGGDASARLQDYERDIRLGEILAQDFETNKQNLVAAEARIKVIDKDLAGLENLSEVVEEDERLNDDLRTLATRRREAQLEFESRILVTGVFSLLKPAFKAVETQASKAAKEGWLPPQFTPASLRALLDSGQCVCGEVLAEDSASAKHIERVIEQFETSSEIGQVLQATSDEIKLTSLSIQGASDGARLLNKRIMELNTDESRLLARREVISSVIANNDADSIAKLGRERSQLQKQRFDLLKDNAQLERQMADHAARIERSKKAYEKATEGDGEVARLRAIASLATRAAAAAGQIHSLVIEMIRKKLESSIDQRFSRLVKKGQFKTEITEDFMIRTVDDLGNYDNLSEGQSMLKAFVFSMSLRDVIGLRLPLLVDTPYGRLSERHRVELSQMLAALVADSANYDGNQVIFLMHDSEYTPYTRKHFLEYNPLETFLSRDDESDVSRLGEGIDPEWLKHTAWKDWAEGIIK